MQMGQKEERQTAILESLKRLGFLRTSQIQTLHNLGSKRNAQRVMKSLEQYVHKFLDGEFVFYLNKAGRERVGTKKQLSRNVQTKHYVMRNDLFLACGCPKDWKTEVKIPIRGTLSVTCDALFQWEGRYHIIEVDHRQKMKANREKIERYKQLFHFNTFEKPPILIWYTTTGYRKQQLAKLCAGLHVRIFTVEDFY